ncbi:beta-lactamase-like protein [Radiomyces spectabilis]|uniref:beta-lactamase-like protein n=1 Tax=Radiomyces spectabilis TaxID=64574 RepID=UPI00222123DF|nr:beta-lactamase-like protein [Radiomyces spectabilis]KAI8388566.1 beta-lactamase-like protein [Radiomyces spectabilis]
MSTFDGQIREYPCISIDRFTRRNGIKYYFLSHVHSDHTQGLEQSSILENIYCSEITATLLPRIRRRNKQYGHLEGRLVPIPIAQETIIDTTDYGKITVTLLPANHCPGAVLILIEGCNGTVLYTGDMRAEKDFVDESLQLLGDKIIDHVYMDTSCCNDKFRHFPTKDASVQLLLQTIKQYHCTFHIYLDCWTFGYEEIWFAIAQVFNTKIHVSRQFYDMYCRADSTFDRILTTDPQTRFHSCNWASTCSMHSAKTLAIHPVPLSCDYTIDMSTPEAPSLLASKLYDPSTIAHRLALPFSTHSSMSEIAGFIRFIRPRRFTATVAHGKWTTVAEMKALLRAEGCFNDGTSSLSSLDDVFFDHRQDTTTVFSISDSDSDEPRSPQQWTESDPDVVVSDATGSQMSIQHDSSLPSTLSWHDNEDDPQILSSKRSAQKQDIISLTDFMNRLHNETALADDEMDDLFESDASDDELQACSMLPCAPSSYTLVGDSQDICMVTEEPHAMQQSDLLSKGHTIDDAICLDE